MDALTAFKIGEANRGREPKVFDWDKAARIIRERGVQRAVAGLLEDWEGTGGEILTEGKPNNESYTHLASTWATPVLVITEETIEIIECYKMAHEAPGWGSGTRWPDSALKILNGGVSE